MSINDIRKYINLLESPLEETMSDAMIDFERESPGKVDIDLANELADDYGLDPARLIALYTDHLERKANIERTSPEAKGKREREAADAKRKADAEVAGADIRSKVNPEHVKAINAFLPTIVTPSGFTREDGQGTMNSGSEIYGKGRAGHTMTEDAVWVKLVSDDIKIIINVSYEDAKEKYQNVPGITVTGHTNFSTPTGWKTFSRTGIDDSFHSDYYDREKGELDINKIVGEQIEKAKTRMADYSTRVEIPGLPGGFTIDPKRVPAITAELQSGGAHSFLPGGMGTGYTIAGSKARRRKGSYDPTSKGSAELAKFFGVSEIYVTPVDAD